MCPSQTQKTNAVTNIDVVLKKSRQLFAFEAENYAAATPVLLDSCRAAMDTLIAYVEAQLPRPVIPVFSITNKPVDLRQWRALTKACEQRGVRLINGNPDVPNDLLKPLASSL